MIKFSIVVATAALALVVALLSSSSSSGVSAFGDNPCTQNWQPNQNYTSFSCPTDELARWALKKAIPPLIFVGVGVVIFAVTACSCLFRYVCQCCGGSKMRPGAFCCGGKQWDDLPPEDVKVAYDPRSVIFTKGLVVVASVLALVAAIISFVGAGKASQLPSVIRDGALGFANWIIGGFDILLDGLDATRSEFSAARSALSSAKSQATDIRDSLEKYASNFGPFSTAFLGLAVPTAVLALSGIGGVVCMLLSIQNGLPAVLIALTMFVAPVTGVLGGVGGLFTVFSGVYCDEVAAHKARQPGIFQNYFVPSVCGSDLKIDAIRDDFRNATNSITVAACDSLRNACSAGDVYSPSSGIYYRCDTAPSCVSGVTTIADVRTLSQTMTVKTGADAACFGSGCTVERCATDCADANVKKLSANITTDVAVVTKALTAMDKVANEYLNCNILTDKFIGVFDICSTLHAGLTDVTTGAAIGLAACILLIVALFLGQKRFFKAPGFNREEAELTLIARY